MSELKGPLGCFRDLRDGGWEEVPVWSPSAAEHRGALGQTQGVSPLPLRVK